MKKVVLFFIKNLHKILCATLLYGIILFPIIIVCKFEKIIKEKKLEPSSCFFKKYKSESELLDSIVNISILYTTKADISIYFAHNNALLSTLQQREALMLDWAVAKEDGLKQVRNFYLVILVAVITLIFSKKVKKRKKYFVLTLFAILLIYILDVHQEDMLNVQCTRYDIVKKAVDSLIISYPNQILLFNLNDHDYNKGLEKARQPSRRHWRKFFLACKLNLERMVYYQIPWFIISFMIIYNSNKKNPTSRTNNKNARNRLKNSMTRFFLRKNFF